MTSETSTNLPSDPAVACSDEPTMLGIRLTTTAFSVFLMSVLALALVIRLYGLGHEDFWLYEIHSMSNSAGLRAEFESLPHGVILEPRPTYTQLPAAVSASDIWRGMEADSHPPLYFVVLMYWRQLFGDGEAACRVLPVLLSVLSIVPVALILREYGHSRAGLWAALALAVAHEPYPHGSTESSI